MKIAAVTVRVCRSQHSPDLEELQLKPKLSARAAAQGGTYESNDESQKRRELLGERVRQTRSARLGPRSADDIRRAYGRPTKQRCNTVIHTSE